MRVRFKISGVLLFYVLFQSTIISWARATDTSKVQAKPASKVQGVITLTARDFDSSISDGNVWLIEFYSPWCGHCKKFAQTYDEIAKHLHQSNENGEQKIMVAKVDGSKEKALSSRFSIRGYPSFFLIDGWDVYEYKAARSKSNMIQFANKKGKGMEPISFLVSPFGPFGQIRALMMKTGTFILDIFDYLVKKKSLSPTFAAVAMASVGVFIGTVFVIIVGLLLLPKPKID